jgi:hypothetical protein
MGQRNPIHIRSQCFCLNRRLSYCLQVTLKARLKRGASGLTPRTVLEKFAAIQMLDVHLPTTDGREIVPIRQYRSQKNLVKAARRPMLADIESDSPNFQRLRPQGCFGVFFA